MVVVVSDALRVCTKCGLKAHTIADLEKFVKRGRCKYGRAPQCKTCRSIYTTTYHYNNPTKVAEYSKRYAERNPEKRVLKDLAYAKANPDKVNARNARYRASKYTQTAELSEMEKAKIALLYKISTMVTTQTGVLMHVDHVKPLSKGGLHHPDNLQVITAEENLKKGSTWLP